MQIVIIIIDIVVILLLVYTWMLLMKTRRIQKYTDELNRQTQDKLERRTSYPTYKQEGIEE